MGMDFAQRSSAEPVFLLRCRMLGTTLTILALEGVGTWRRESATSSAGHQDSKLPDLSYVVIEIVSSPFRLCCSSSPTPISCT